MTSQFHLKAIFLLAFLFAAQTSIAQIVLKPNYGVDDLLVGYATRADVYAKFGPGGDTIRNKFLPPIDENDTAEGYVRSNEVFYKKLGIHFIYDRDDSEIISGLYFVKPFVGLGPKGAVIKPGVMTVEDLIITYGLETVKAHAGTTTASSYWYSEIDSVHYYFRKDTSGKYLHRHDDWWMKTFDESLPFLRKQIVTCVGMPLPFSNRYVLKTFTKNDATFFIPLYSPDSEHHLNTSMRDNNPLNILKFGEGAWPNTKVGYWRNYHPNHTLASEGNYDDDHEVGIFKYYDESGNFIKAIDYGSHIVKKKR